MSETIIVAVTWMTMREQCRGRNGLRDFGRVLTLSNVFYDNGEPTHIKIMLGLSLIETLACLIGRIYFVYDLRFAPCNIKAKTPLVLFTRLTTFMYTFRLVVETLTPVRL